jgi:hypothetical protein
VPHLKVLKVTPGKIKGGRFIASNPSTRKQKRTNRKQPLNAEDRTKIRRFAKQHGISVRDAVKFYVKAGGSIAKAYELLLRSWRQ